MLRVHDNRDAVRILLDEADNFFSAEGSVVTSIMETVADHIGPSEMDSFTLYVFCRLTSVPLVTEAHEADRLATVFEKLVWKLQLCDEVDQALTGDGGFIRVVKGDIMPEFQGRDDVTNAAIKRCLEVIDACSGSDPIAALYFPERGGRFRLPVARPVP